MLEYFQQPHPTYHSFSWPLASTMQPASHSHFTAYPSPWRTDQQRQAHISIQPIHCSTTTEDDLLRILNLEDKLRRADLARLQICKAFLNTAKSTWDNGVWVRSEPPFLQSFAEEAEKAIHVSCVIKRREKTYT